MMNIENCHHYTDSGLQNVWLANGFTKKPTPYGEAVGIDNLDGLHKAIAAVIIDKPSPLTGDEIRFLRVELDLSQKRLGEYVGKSDQSVAKWEKDEAEAPDDVDYLLRHIYRQTTNKSSVYVEEVDRLRELDNTDYQEIISFREENGAWQKSTNSCLAS